ncbi:MAG: aminoglycoside phosphotransferase family protein [Bacteroidetes bacterium]|nr:aminoglycoside phosphotransferase family protein [Bacteroidota bacterium]
MSAEEVVREFGVEGSVKISPLGSGHIHRTYKVEAARQFVLQRVNKTIFTQPDVIASNNRLAFQYLKQHHPDFIFPQALPDLNGNDLFYDDEGFPWRLYPLIENTFTIDEVSTEQEAYEAAKGFAALSKNLYGIDTQLLKPTLDRFHDLSWRYKQFENALQKASPETIQMAKAEIEQAQSFQPLVSEYTQLIKEGVLQLRVMHNDTKVNNILFDSISRKAVCAIDLDTLMPGYFIYDLGDMVRTFVSPVTEEEKDISKIEFRKNIYNALVQGYLSQMGDVLTEQEMKFIPFAGKMMTYIMGLRFLADYLRGNTYYHITYPEQNRVRAKNQFHLLSLIEKNV